MNKIVRCRCGHQVMAREVLRTDLYERASGRDYIYIKFRCTRCKRLGQTFIPEARFDWSSLESAADEMTPQERDRALEAGPISTGELMAFHAVLKLVASIDQLQTPAATPQKSSAETSEQNDKSAAPNPRFARSPRRRKRQSDKRQSDNRQSDNRNRERGDNSDDEQNAANGSGDDCNAT